MPELKQPVIKPISIPFSEKWNNTHLGIDYSESMWHEPTRRIETLREIRHLHHERFGDVNLGHPDPKPSPNLERYGHRFMSALFGCEIRYSKNQAPNAIHMDVDYDYMAKLEIPDFDKSPVIRTALEEAELFNRKYGFCSGSINTGSPLNNAVSIFGETFLMAIAEEPEIAQHVLKVIADTQVKLYHEIQHKIDPQRCPEPINSWAYGNCPAIMISPSMYRNVILDIDKYCRQFAPNFLLHHCGIFDQYIDIYSELDATAIEVGGGSDYCAIRETFPETPLILIINASDVEQKAPAQIDAHIQDMVDRAAPADKISGMYIMEFNDDFSDEGIKALATTHERIFIRSSRLRPQA